jgi:hypothetical protein
MASASIRCAVHKPAEKAAGRSAVAAQPRRVSLGNQAHLRRLQAKLSIGGVHDPLEQEADAVADRVMRGGDLAPQAAPAISKAAPATLSRKCAECEDEERKGSLQRKVSSGAMAARDAPPIVDAVLASPGRALDPPVQDFMASRLGADFSRVRIHSDAKAARSAAAVGARAYTVGNSIVFGTGEFNPASTGGRRLLAHELAHVVQQGGDSAGGAPDRRLMREPLANAEFKMCHRVVVGETWFDVDKGGLIVRADAHWVDKEEDDDDRPRAAQPDYGASTFRIGVEDDGWWDKDHGGCGFPIGRPFSRQWIDLPKGHYHLVVSMDDHNSNFCVQGQIEIVQQEGLTGESCTRAPRGAWEIIHDALSLAGLLPVLGVVPDALNTGIYLIEGNWKEAGISAIAMIPYLGDGAQLVRRGAKMAIKVTDKGILKAGEQAIADGFKEVKAAEAAKEAKAAVEARKAIAGAEEVKLAQAEYEAALKTVFPSHYLGDATRLVDEVGQGAARRAMQNPRFISAMENGNMTLAGTFFHTAAKEEARAVATAGRLPPGWTLKAEETMKAGRGGSRLDIFMTGPAGEVVEIDWKTTGRSALSTKSVDEMAKHAGEVRVKVGADLTTQQSRSWMDYIRPLL